MKDFNILLYLFGIKGGDSDFDTEHIDYVNHQVSITYSVVL